MPLLLHRVEQFLALRAVLETVDGVDVVEQEGQVEDLQLGRVLGELGQRRGDDLHVAEQQGLHLLAVTEQLAVREDLDLDLARQGLLGEFLELQRGLALRGLVGHDVAVLDDDGLRDGGRVREHEGGSDGEHAEWTWRSPLGLKMPWASNDGLI